MHCPIFPGAWIITGGTATGVMQFVGEAVRDHLITLGSNDNKVVALGIATWGCIANRESLDGEGVLRFLLIYILFQLEKKMYVSVLFLLVGTVTWESLMWSVTLKISTHWQ